MQNAAVGLRHGEGLAPADRRKTRRLAKPLPAAAAPGVPVLLVQTASAKPACPERCRAPPALRERAASRRRYAPRNARETRRRAHSARSFSGGARRPRSRARSTPARQRRRGRARLSAPGCGKPSRASSTLSVPIRSGAVSASVPSRSKTKIGGSLLIPSPNLAPWRRQAATWARSPRYNVPQIGCLASFAVQSEPQNSANCCFVLSCFRKAKPASTFAEAL